MPRHTQRYADIGQPVREPPASILAITISISIGLLLAWQTISIYTSIDQGAQPGELTADDYAYDTHAAKIRTAESLLRTGHPEEAEAIARSVLIKSPISAPALRIVGMAQQKTGNVEGSSALLSEGAALGWRDTSLQLWLVAGATRAGDFTTAAARLDAALRTAPEPHGLFRFVDAAAKITAFRQAIVDRLTERPDWRIAYFKDQAFGGPDVLATRAQLLGDLIATEAPPSRDELAAVVAHLISAGLFEQAHALWFSANHAGSSLLYDGNFDAPAAAGNTIAYEWSLRSIPGASAEIEPRGSADVRALHAVVTSNTSGTLAQQSLQLRPGRYVLSVDSDGVASAKSSFSWVVRCVQGGPPLLSLPITAERKAEGDFTIAGTVCARQDITLHVDSTDGPSAAERWFENVAVSPIRP